MELIARHRVWASIVIITVTAFAATLGATTQASQPAPVVPPPLTVFSAGSAKGVLTAIFARYRQETGGSVTEVAGAAGSMLDRIEAGEQADIFVSANIGYPRRLTAEGKSAPTIVFARNSLCVIALPSVGITDANILGRLLDPKVRIGSSDPKNDPSGQYAFAVFDKADKLHPGAAAILKAKVRIPGSATNAAPAIASAAKPDAAHMLEARGVDAMVSFCSTSGTAPDKSVTRVALPAELTVPVAYGLTVLTKAGDPARREAAYRLAAYLMSPDAQAILPEYGFQPVSMVANDQL